MGEMVKQKKVNKVGIFQLKGVRLSYPQLWVPKAMEEGQKEKYGCALLIPKTEKRKPDIALIRKAVYAVRKEKWGPDEKKWPKLPQPYLHDGDEKSDTDGYKGMWYISPKNERKPVTIDRDKSLVDSENGAVYGGCFVIATCRAYAYEGGKTYKGGVSISLEMIQKYADGERFGGGGIDVNEYAVDVEDGSENEANYEDGDDDDASSDEKEEETTDSDW